MTEHVQSCRVCGSANTSSIVDGGTKCADCDAVFRNVPMDTTLLHDTFEVYPRRYRLYDRIFWKRLATPYIEYLREKTSMDFGNALDIGCYFGHFVKMLKEEGIKARGIEANVQRVANAVTEGIEQGYFDEQFKTDEKFDLVSFNEILYYLPNGVEVLRHARTLLNDGGMVLITTANPSSTMVTTKEIPILEKPWINLYLSRKNFEQLEGFELVDYTPLRTNMLIDVAKSRLMFLPYAIGIKRASTYDSDGNHAFVLLKKT